MKLLFLLDTTKFLKNQSHLPGNSALYLAEKKNIWENYVEGHSMENVTNSNPYVCVQKKKSKTLDSV